MVKEEEEEVAGTRCTWRVVSMVAMAEAPSSPTLFMASERQRSVALVAIEEGKNSMPGEVMSLPSSPSHSSPRFSSSAAPDQRGEERGSSRTTNAPMGQQPPPAASAVLCVSCVRGGAGRRACILISLTRGELPGTLVADGVDAEVEGAQRAVAAQRTRQHLGTVHALVVVTGGPTSA
jgi:hypothetical protein